MFVLFVFLTQIFSTSLENPGIVVSTFQLWVCHEILLLPIGF